MSLLEFATSLRLVARHAARAFLLASIGGVLVSCGGGGGGGGASGVGGGNPPPTTYTATSGVAQKGPLISGSAVTAQELDASLSPTGKQYSYQVTSNLGTFSPTSTFTSQYIGLIATGYYFDEVQNALSSGPVTLNGYSDLNAGSVLNVNLLTTLAYQRIQHLVTSSGLTFAAAEAQAEKEVLTALSIPAGNLGSFGTLDLSGGTDGDHMLAAISSIFVYGNSSGPLSFLIANFQSDIGTHGVITSPATKAALVAAGKAINPAAVAANLTQAYSSAHVTFTAANISDWIDQDADGVIGKFKFQFPDATPSSVFTFPSFVVSQVVGTSVSVTAGQLSVNGTPASSPVSIQAGDVITLSPGVGAFPNGVLTSYLLTGSTNVARVSFVSGLVSIAVTPSNPSIPKGLTQQFTATGTFSDNNTADLTHSVSWSSGTPTIATVNATSGLAISLAVGSTIVTATSGSVSGYATLNVTPAILQSIGIGPYPVSGIGLPRQLRATGTYSDATTANVTNIATWTSGTPSVATVGQTTGLATGVSLGSTTISATIGSVTGSASLTIVTHVWSPTGGLSTARTSHTATLLPNGKVLVAGGIEAAFGPLFQPTYTTLASAELYDPVTEAWSPTGSLSTARSGHTATLLPNGMVLVASGDGNGASTELYNPATGTWSPTGSLSTARSGHTATLLLNGMVLVASGTSAELYIPATGTWSPTGSLSTAHTSHTATLLPSGMVLVAGGYITASAELYDPVAGTWSSTGSLSAARGGHTATLLNGKVLVVGGGLQAALFTYNTAELYDPVTGTWSPTGSVSKERREHTATLLANGVVLVAGGHDYHFALASAELYDPVTGTWTPTGSLSTAHTAHTATLLQSGMVLVAGGYVAWATFSSASAELYW